MSADNNVIISVKDLKKYYNDGEVKALDGVTTDIKKGEVVVVIGQINFPEVSQSARAPDRRNHHI